MPKGAGAGTEIPIPHTYADVDATHTPSDILRALREEILKALEQRRIERYGTIDETLFLFDELVTMAQRQLARGRDH